jgi:hypothetical protein
MSRFLERALSSGPIPDQCYQCRSVVRFWFFHRDLPISLPHPRFFNFYCKQSTSAIRPKGDPGVTLGWPRRDPGVSLGSPNPSPKPNGPHLRAAFARPHPSAFFAEGWARREWAESQSAEGRKMKVVAVAVGSSGQKLRAKSQKPNCQISFPFTPWGAAAI